MSDVFQPQNYIRAYEEASDAEHVEGAWVHPKLPNRLEAYAQGTYAQDTAIVALSATTVNLGVRSYGVGACYFGPGHRRNKHVHFHENDDEVTHQLINVAVAKAALHAVGSMKQGSGPGSQRLVHGINTTELNRIVFKVHSPFMAELLTKDGRVNMRRPGWTSSCGKELQEPEWTDAIEDEVDRLEALGLKILVWHVSEEENAEVAMVMDGAMWEIGCYGEYPVSYSDPGPDSEPESGSESESESDSDYHGGQTREEDDGLA